MEENNILRNWHLKLAIIAGILIPAITAADAFYDLKAKFADREAQVAGQIFALQLQNNKDYADKSTMKELQESINNMKNDITEIKTLLIRKSR